MFQLVYISFKSESFDPNGSNGIDEILQKANEFNRSKGITGMLLYRGGVFSC